MPFAMLGVFAYVPKANCQLIGFFPPKKLPEFASELIKTLSRKLIKLRLRCSESLISIESIAMKS